MSTRLGVQPLGTGQGQSKAFWIHAAVEPTTGEPFFLQFTQVASQGYQLFLDQFSHAYPDRLHIFQVDNGAFHKAKDRGIPDNLMLLFQPPDGPELHPIERLWQHLKKDLCWALFQNLTQLQTKVDKLIAD